MITAAAWSLALAALIGGDAEKVGGDLFVKADAAHLGDGRVIAPATIVIKDGRIVSVSTGGSAPGGARVIELENVTVTPGLIEAASRAGRIGSGVEEGEEITPAVDVTPQVDVTSDDFRVLRRSGVTTVFVGPSGRNVIGGAGAVFKTGGSDGGVARLIEAPAMLCATMGSEPSSGNSSPWGGTPRFNTRRPTTRMGVVWAFRKAFYEAKEDASRGRTTDAAGARLASVLGGEMPLRIRARKETDVRTAVRLADELDLPPFVLVEGQEAFRAADLLRDRQVRCIVGPIRTYPHFDRLSGDGEEAVLESAARLLGAGVTTALSAGDSFRSEGMPVQGTFARRHGMGLDDVVRATTSTPAGILGLGGRLGSLEPGMDGDLVIWNGEPFSAAARPVVVVIDGNVVFEAPSAGSKQAEKK